MFNSREKHFCSVVRWDVTLTYKTHDLTTRPFSSRYCFVNGWIPIFLLTSWAPNEFMVTPETSTGLFLQFWLFFWQTPYKTFYNTKHQAMFCVFPVDSTPGCWDNRSGLHLHAGHILTFTTISPEISIVKSHCEASPCIYLTMKSAGVRGSATPMKIGGGGGGGTGTRRQRRKDFLQRVTHTKNRKLSGFGPLFSWKWGDYPPHSQKWRGRVPPSPLWRSPWLVFFLC